MLLFFPCVSKYIKSDKTSRLAVRRIMRGVQLVRRVFAVMIVVFGLVVVWFTNCTFAWIDHRWNKEEYNGQFRVSLLIIFSTLVFHLLLSPVGASSVPAFFSEDDSQSNDSSDSDSSSSQSDDVDQETFLFDEPLERTTSASHANSAAQAPRSMQWAVRNTPSQRATGSTPTSSSTPAGQCRFECWVFTNS